jgi:hypothetical protein
MKSGQQNHSASGDQPRLRPELVADAVIVDAPPVPGWRVIDVRTADAAWRNGTGRPAGSCAWRTQPSYLKTWMKRPPQVAVALQAIYQPLIGDTPWNVDLLLRSGVTSIHSLLAMDRWVGVVGLRRLVERLDHQPHLVLRQFETSWSRIRQKP